MTRTMLALAAAALTGAAAHAAGPDDAAMRAYVLTMPKLQAYARGINALRATKDPAVKAEMPRLDGLLNNGIGGGLAKLRSAPHVEAVLHGAGVSDGDFVMIPSVLIGASMAASSPEAAKQMPVSPANITFVKAHAQEIGALKLMDGD